MVIPLTGPLMARGGITGRPGCKVWRHAAGATMKARVFRDPVHGLIGLRGDDVALDRVLGTRAMQRLRRIRQMGFASLVYPGAEHSRFGHAIGAFHVAHRVVGGLALPHPVARDVKVAALLHDVGHGPFSHAWE